MHSNGWKTYKHGVLKWEEKQHSISGSSLRQTLKCLISCYQIRKSKQAIACAQKWSVKEKRVSGDVSEITNKPKQRKRKYSLWKRGRLATFKEEDIWETPFAFNLSLYPYHNQGVDVGNTGPVHRLLVLSKAIWVA